MQNTDIFFLFLSPKFDGVYLREKCACTSVLTDHTRDRLLSERIMYGQRGKLLFS